MLVAASNGLYAQEQNDDPDAARIVTTDIANFWEAYDLLAAAQTREDSLDAFRAHYFDVASPGLQAFVRLRIQKAGNILRALEQMPRYFAAIRQTTLRVGETEPRIREGLQRLERLYPAALFPDVYFVIGVFNTKGTFSPEGLLLGAEMLAADATTPTDELPVWAPPIDTSSNAVTCLVVHELVHAQQEYRRGRFLLAQALREGVANFLARLIIGCPGSASYAYEYGVMHERELWEEFRQVMTGAYTDWMYNGARSADRPANLGYWMGDRIAEAYYERSADKRQAVYDLLHISDYTAFLEASGYDTKWGR